MKTNINLFIALFLLNLIGFFPTINTEVSAQTYPCASTSPLPYPESNTCLQAFLSIRPDCCDIDFDMSCYSNMSTGFVEVCEDGNITTWENCYDHNLYDGINIAGTNSTCMLDQATLPPLFLFAAFECCDLNNCSPCFTGCDPPPNDGTCPLAPVIPYDGCLVEVILFDGFCGGFLQCLPPGPGCVNQVQGGWDMCCDMIYNDLMNGMPNPGPAYDNCGYGNSKPTGTAKYPCDDLDPLTIDQCHPNIGCINIPDYTNVTPAANLKLWLQGASLGAVMTTNPSTASGQPFNTVPWNYAGTEAASVPTNTVDWILVEALDVTTFAVLDRAAGFLLNDGTVQDVDGTAGQIKFQGGTLIPTDSHYIAVRTRGHLDVISAVPVAVLGTLQYDFTTAISQALNTTNGSDQDQLVEANGTGTGAPYALHSGDTNGDGIINFEDFNRYFLQIGAGYKTADFNHDGMVDGTDFDPHFTKNNGKMGVQQLRY